MATKISDNGFFSEEAIQKSEAIRREHRQLFFYLAEVNEQAHRYPGLLKVESNNFKQVFTVALFARALTAYQGLIMLAQRSFASEARATCRNILEAKFKLAYLLKEPEAALLLIAKGEKERAKRLRSMQAGDLPVPPELANEDWDSRIKSAEKHLKDAKGKKRKILSTKDIAYRCGLKVDYIGYYSVCSEAAHAGHIELETYLKFNADTTAVEAFVYGPEDGGWIDWITLQGAGYLLDCMEISASIFGVRSTRDFQLLFKRILRRNNEMMQRYRDLFIVEVGTGKLPASK